MGAMLRVGKKILSIVVSLALLVLIIAWMAGALHKKIAPSVVAAQERALQPGHALGEIHRVTEQVVESVIGTVVAERKTSVSSKIMAAIEAVHVVAGTNVKQGSLLVDLDARDLRSQAQQARDALSGAQAALTQARDNFERMKSMLAQKVISRSEYDAAEAQFKVARSAMEAATRAKETAEVAVTYAAIRAPINGRVVDRLAEPGDTATPGRPLLTLYDPSALRLEAPVREGLATKLKIGDPLKVHIDSLGMDLDGRVDEIVPQAETASRSLLVKVGIPNRSGLYTGLFGRLLIPVGQRQRICMPKTAITRVGQLEYVDVVRVNGTLEKRFIQTGEHNELGSVEVLSGAEPGEKVVLSR